MVGTASALTKLAILFILLVVVLSFTECDLDHDVSEIISLSPPRLSALYPLGRFCELNNLD